MLADLFWGFRVPETLNPDIKVNISANRVYIILPRCYTALARAEANAG